MYRIRPRVGESLVFSSKSIFSVVPPPNSLANPSQIHSDNVKFPLNVIMGLGIKRTILKNWSSFNKFNDPTFKAALRKALMSAHIANLDRAVAPTLNRNEPFYPFSSRVGYKNGEAYWLDSSSYRLIRHISVPFLNLVARNDAISSTPSKNKFSFSLLNPNVLVVETECGGHLGWQESPPDSGSFGATSWADVAAADFFDSVMQVNTERTGRAVGSHQKRSLDDIASIDMDSDLLRKLKKESLATSTKLLSKL